ncbi:tetraspanin-1-like [Anneissia japonica]|uniref:tetraspanin-1-like n=1 Tax=Anneissia japonica TaxID=1529436 RepID=UPI0014258184|nr:tetraspanin-1-like [Anneissia japonica]
MCCTTFARALLIIFNIIFCAIGISILSVGIWIVTDPHKLDILAILDNAVVANTAYILIGLGIFIVIVSILGFCGGIKKNKCILIIYFIIVLVVFWIQFISCSIVIAYKDKVDVHELGDSMDNYITPWDDDNKYNNGWNSIQILLECCGTNSSADWKSTPYAGSSYLNKTWTYPPSCCKVADLNDFEDGKYPTPVDVNGCVSNPNADNMNSNGCYQAFQDWVEKNALFIGGPGLGLAFLEIFCLVYAMCIICCD